MNTDLRITTMADAGFGGENGILSKRPYIATNGRYAGQPVVTVNTGQRDAKGNPIYGQKPISANASLRKDDWVEVDRAIINPFLERLVITEDMRTAGLTHNVGSLGVLTSEWETQSEMTDAEATMDGESTADMDRVQFGLNGVPIPVIQKPFKIPERTLLASRAHGGNLDTANAQAAARSVARRTEDMIFNGLSIPGGQYQIYGLNNFPGRAQFEITDWSDPSVTPEEIYKEFRAMIAFQKVNNRVYGPFSFYIPPEYEARFYEDFKANSDKTLMQRVLDDADIDRIRTSDVQKDGNVSMVQMTSDVLDLAIASDVTTVQWASGSGWTNWFQVFAAWAPRLKADYDGRSGILHGATA